MDEPPVSSIRTAGLRRLSEAIDAAHLLLGRGVAVLTLLMVLLGAYNAVARHLGKYLGSNLSSNAFIEGQWYMFSLVFLLGAATTLAQDRHVRVDVFYGRLGPRGKATVDLLGTLLFLLPFCVFCIWTTWPAVANSFAVREVSPDPGGLPRWPIKAMIPLAFVLLFLQGLSEAARSLLRLGEARAEGAAAAEGGEGGGR